VALGGKSGISGFWGLKYTCTGLALDSGYFKNKNIEKNF
jgi:hypothetical protein